MSSIPERLSGLSPERRRLLDHLLAERAGLPVSGVGPGHPAGVTSGADGSEPSAPSRETGDLLSGVGAPGAEASGADVKAYYRRMYDAASAQLDAAPFAPYATFCTFGYVCDESSPYSRVTLPTHLLNKNTIALVLEVIGDQDLTGRDIVDVGCGRGGTVSVVVRYFAPRRVVGVDLSWRAVAFSRRNHRGPGVTFLEADAEVLPLKDTAFDVVINVESSHSYPDIGAFYAEAARVLRGGGHFLYTDVFPRDRWPAHLGLLEDAGFRPERDRDITNNVLRSCDETATHKLAAYAPDNDPEFMNTFLGTPRSDVYAQMKTGVSAYRILTLRKAGD